MKRKNYILYAVLALVLTFPGIISILFFMLTDTISQGNKNISLELTDTDGKTYFFENTHDMSILFYDIIGDDKKTPSKEGLTGFSEEDAFKVTVMEDGKKTVYDFFFDRTSPSACLFRSESGSIYKVKADKAIEFMDSVYAAALYPYSSVPQLMLNDHAAVPSDIKWEYYSYSSVRHSMDIPTADKPINVDMSFLDFDLSFTKSPDKMTIDIKDSLGREFFSGSYAEFVLSGMFSKITDSEKYTCVLTAIWDDIGSDCCGSATYRFNLNVDFDPPGIFWLNADTVECGGFVILSGKHIIDKDSIVVSSVPSLDYEPMFFEDGEYIRAILPIKLSNGLEEIIYQINVSYDGTSADFTLKTKVPKLNSNRNYNHSGRLNTSVRTDENLKEFVDFVTYGKYEETIYKSFSFVSPPSKSFRAAFGDTVKNTGSSKFTSNGIAFYTGYDDSKIVKAALAGMVVAVGETDYGGNTVVIDHGLGLRSVYYGLSSNYTAYVSKGRIVAAGDAIASGSARKGYTDGETCYVELWVGDTPVSYRSLVNTGFGIDYGEEPSVSEK